MSKKAIDHETVQSAARVLRVLAHPTRLRIIEKLKTSKQSVGELVSLLKAPQAVVSKHLAILKSAGILASETDFNFRYYSLANPKVLKVLDCIKKSCPKEVSS